MRLTTRKHKMTGIAAGLCTDGTMSDENCTNSQAELDALIAEAECWTCGGAGHLSGRRLCPDCSPSTPGSTAAHVAAAGMTPAEWFDHHGGNGR